MVLLVLLIATAVAVSLAPMAAVRRIAGLWALALLLILVTLPPDWDDAFGTVSLYLSILMVLLAFVPLAIRLVWRAWRGDPPAPETQTDVALTAPLSAITGGLGAVLAFLFLAQKLGGSDPALTLHMTIGLGCAGLAVWAWRQRIFGAVGFGVGLLVLTVFSYAWFPERVLSQARLLAGEDAHCIGLTDRHRPAAHRSDLTFLTMDKRPGWRHAQLVISRGAPQTAHWSYRKLAFDDLRPLPIKYARLHIPAACLPDGRHGLAPTSRDYELLTPQIAMRIPPDALRGKPGLYMSLDDPASEATHRLGTTVHLMRGAWVERLPNGTATGTAHGLQTDGQGLYWRRAAGVTVTHIQCRGTCQHHFARDGHLFTRDFVPADLPGWQAAEDALAAKVRVWTLPRSACRAPHPRL
ncbi:hypothetical protein [Mesobacterium pallidum]|uniref:hypothetical protein n=1 Tax=Mesobacterium pallidum TaxID=2872037 RepID=UPI001EE2EE73|nr:hypothetical protein [Mesobacterium pallidum]